MRTSRERLVGEVDDRTRDISALIDRVVVLIGEISRASVDNAEVQRIDVPSAMPQSSV